MFDFFNGKKMNKIKQKYYKWKILPKFIKNAQEALIGNNLLMRIKFEEDKAIIYYIINNKLLKFEKSTQEMLLYNEIDLENIVSFIGEENLPNFINDFKLNAEIVSSQNLIDFVSHNFKDAVSYYKFTRKEYEKIYQVILKHSDFFKFNPPALVIHNEGIINKWID